MPHVQMMSVQRVEFVHVDGGLAKDTALADGEAADWDATCELDVGECLDDALHDRSSGLLEAHRQLGQREAVFAFGAATTSRYNPPPRVSSFRN